MAGTRGRTRVGHVPTAAPSPCRQIRTMEAVALMESWRHAVAIAGHEVEGAAADQVGLVIRVAYAASARAAQR